MNARTVIAIFLYMLPSIVAIVRHSEIGWPRFWNVVVFNYLLGWLIIPWFVALYWACKRKEKGPDVYDLADRHDL